MNLSEHLLDRDISDLNKIATLYECDCNRNSKLELVQAIHHRIFSSVQFEQKATELEQPDVYFLNFLLFQPQRHFEMGEMIAKAKYINECLGTDDHPRTYLAKFMSKGWLFPTRTKFHVRFEFPVDLHKHLQRKWLQVWKEKLGQRDEQLGHVYVTDEGNALLHDTYTFLDYVAHNPVPLTKDGVIHKREQQKLLKLLQVREEIVKPNQWRFGYGRRFPVYPSRFAFLYDYCFAKGWIDEGQHVLYTTPEGEDMVTGHRMRLSIEDMIKFWYKRYRKPIPALSFLVAFILQLCSSEWVSLEDVIKVIKPWVKPFYYDDQQTIIQERVMMMLVHFGLLQKAEDQDGNVWVLAFKK